MQQKNFEQEAVTLFESHIEEVCSNRWLNIEPEDRRSEAILIFCHALRLFPIGSGHFWNDYLKMLTEQMNELNKRTPSLKFGRNLSLDRPYQNRNGNKSITPMDCVRGCAIDHTRLHVESFMKSLSYRERVIILARMQNIPKRRIAEGLGLTLWKLNQILNGLGLQYKTCNWHENKEKKDIKI